MKKLERAGCNKPFIPTKNPVKILSTAAQTRLNVPGLGSSSNDYFLAFFFFFLGLLQIIFTFVLVHILMLLNTWPQLVSRSGQ